MWYSSYLDMVSDPDTSKLDDTGTNPADTGTNPAACGATVVVVVVVVVVGVNIDPKNIPVAIPNGNAIKSSWRPSAIVEFENSGVK